MGMFDYFISDTSCPVCGNYLTDPYQTKDFERLMDTYQPGNKVNIEGPIRVYTHCRHEICLDKIDDGAIFSKEKVVWIEYKIPIVNKHIPKDQNLWELQPLKEYDIDTISFAPETMTTEDIVLRYLKYNEKMKRDIHNTEFEKRKYDILDLI